jgi:hypothetical protein
MNLIIETLSIALDVTVLINLPVRLLSLYPSD